MSTKTSAKWITKVLCSCKTTEQVDNCRGWIDQLVFRRDLEPAAAAVLRDVADVRAEELAPAWFFPMSVIGTSGAPAVL